MRRADAHRWGGRAAGRDSDVVGDVKVGLAIGHIDIDPWAGPPTGEFHVRPAAARDGSFGYLAAGEAQFPAPFCGAHEALLLRVGAHGIAVTATATGTADLEWGYAGRNPSRWRQG